MSSKARSDLSKFAETRDEAAFRRVVGEFGGLVLAAARRRTDDPELAEEVAQNVFAIMARKAGRIARYRAISAWVFTTTRLESAKALRGRQRHRRKLEALANEINSNTDMTSEDMENWRDALPHLEAGLDQLGDADRETLLARFFENRTFKQIASDTGKTEAACKMRVHRSLAKLKAWMARRGVTLSATAMAAGLGAEWAQSASAATVTTISSNAVAAAPALGTGTLLGNAIMTMNATKSACLAAATVIAIGAIPIAIQQAKANLAEEQLAQQQSRPDRRPAPVQPRTAGPQPEKLSPAQRMQREANLPGDPKALASALMDAVAAQNLGAVMRAMVALSRMSREEIDALITRVSESDAHLGTKQGARRMLIGFMDADGKDGAALLDTALASDVQLFHTLRPRLARWAETDPAGAAAWIQEHRDDERLETSTGSNPIGELIFDAVLPGMARTDPERAIRQLDALGARIKWSTTAAVAGAILGRGEEGDFERARAVLMRLDDDRRRSGIGVASKQPMRSVEQFDAVLELARAMELPPKSVVSAAYWMATTQVDLPARERADWVRDRLGDRKPSSLRNFVWNTRQREADLGRWIAELPAGSFKDHALRGEVTALVNNLHDGAEALARSLEIGDNAMRAEALRFTLGKFPDAAKEAPAAANAEIAAALAAPNSQSPAPAPATAR